MSTPQAKLFLTTTRLTSHNRAMTEEREPLVYTYAETTGPTWEWKVEWVEMSRWRYYWLRIKQTLRFWERHE